MSVLFAGMSLYKMKWMDINEVFSSACLRVASAHYKHLSIKPYMSIVLSVKNQVNKLIHLQLSNGLDNAAGRTEISSEKWIHELASTPAHNLML